MKVKNSKIVLTFLSFVLFCVAAFTYTTPTYSDDSQESQMTEEAVKTSDFKTSGRIWIAGDSIAADHSYEDEANYARFVHGWGEMIGNYLTEDAQVYNKAISGQTAKFFTEESNYQDIMNGIGEGDFLLIQFGHNDYKSAGSDHSTLPTNTEGSYKWYLKHYYIDPALEVGAMPVLCTSVVQCRMEADGTVGSEQAQKKFADAMRVLYEEYCQQGIEIGFIDTYALTQTYLGANAVDAKNLYALKYDRSYQEGGSRTTSLDHVHFSAAGADMTANMIAQNLMLLYEDFNRFSKKGVVDGGDGTVESPYLISTWCQLYQIMQDDARNTSEVYYKLTNNLLPMIQQQEWTTTFRGHLDGDNHTIYNVVGTGLHTFFDENYGTIRNLKLNYNLNHEVTDAPAAFVRDNYGIIENCNITGDIAFTCYEGLENSCWEFGGFASANHEGAAINNCINQSDMSLNGNIPLIYMGGIAGHNAGVIENCVNTGDMFIDSYEYDPKNHDPIYPEIIHVSGGIAGIEAETSKIKECSCEKMPVCMTTLKYNVQVLLQDKISPVTEAELKVILENQNPSQNPDATDAPEVSQKPQNSQNPGTSQLPQNSKEPAVTQTPGQNNKGDLDGDQKITLEDAQLALKGALKIITIEENQLKAADLNEDGKVSLDEVQRILKATLKIISI